MPKKLQEQKLKPKPDITQVDTMREVQGDKVVVYTQENGTLEARHLLTLIRVVDQEKQELHLVNREKRSAKPDWPLTQAFFDHLRPAAENKFEATWEITVKT